MKRSGPLIVTFALALAAQGHAQDDDEDVASLSADRAPPASQEACFLNRDIQDFDPLSRDLILVEDRRDNLYLLTVFPGCIGLQSSIGIAIESALARVCSNSSADIRYRGVSGRLETCPIQKVEAVASKEDAERIAELRSESR